MSTIARRSSLMNLPAWFMERFPLVNVISAFVMYFMVAAGSRQIFEGSVHFPLLADMAGGLGLTGFFLLMRVSDEFKDYALDAQLYPERILQSGQIQLKHLLMVGAVAAAVMLALSFLHHGLAPWFCVLNLVLVALLNREFFAKRWLHEHILFCAFAHMVVATTSSLWIVSMITHDLSFSRPLIALLALPYCSGLSFEFARKSFGHEENRAGLESYTRILGVKTSSYLLAGALASTALVFGFTVYLIFPQHFVTALCISLPLATFALSAALRFRSLPTKKGRKLNEAIGGLFILVNYLVLIGFSLWT
jgi:4-hydroxybenzoate polyprenyltransferase